MVFDTEQIEIEAPSPFNYLTKLSYDENKKLSEVAAQLGSTFSISTAQITEYTYDTLDHLETITDPREKVTTYGYGNSENLDFVMDPVGAAASTQYETAYDYD